MHGPRIAFEGVLFALGLFLMWRVLFRDRSWSNNVATGSQPRISVVIPARNEAHQVRRLLHSLEVQDVAPYEVIVVDDDSSDGTGTIAHQAGATVITGEPLPVGWNGKSWACWQGACRSAGDVLLFLDADTWLETEGIGRLLNLYRGFGLLTVQPYHVTERPYEQLSAFFNIVVMAAVGAFTPLGEHLKPGGAFGPCVMCTREEYFRVGGHREVRGELLEDIPLAKRFLRHHLPVSCHPGRGLISFRMYPGGLWELVEGWSKGMGYGAFSVHPALSLMTAAWITGCFGAFLALIRSALGGSPAWAGVMVYGSYALLVWWMLRRIGRFRWWASVLFPIPLCFFGVVIVRSLLLTYILRRVVWKGRTLSKIQRGGKPGR